MARVATSINRKAGEHEAHGELHRGAGDESKADTPFFQARQYARAGKL
jgi:hypothetical protein